MNEPAPSITYLLIAPINGIPDIRGRIHSKHRSVYEAFVAKQRIQDAAGKDAFVDLMVVAEERDGDEWRMLTDQEDNEVGIAQDWRWPDLYD